ncbi:MAG: hypothetical protein ABSA83_19710 [Verrucomicrobiota bacterium]|jgi:Kef-type K+ transport system membrane component KefB
MNFEDMQKAWQSHNASAKVLIDADALLKEVRHNQRHFRAMIFWRDAREVGLCVVVGLLFLHWAIRDHAWFLYLLILACAGVGSFMVVDRLIQRRKQPVANESLKTCIEVSLLQVNHQIWLLKNVVWWYLLPFAPGLAIATGVSVWRSRHVALVVAGGCVYLVLVVLLYWGVYWLNQYAVRRTLAPRQQELETLLASLE